MLDPAVTLLLFSAATICLVVVTVTVVMTAAQVRSTLRRLDALLPDAGEALRELRRSGRQVRQILTRTNMATRSVEGIILRACEAASEALERVALFKESAQQFWSARFSHGAGSGPRSHHRNGKGHGRRVVE